MAKLFELHGLELATWARKRIEDEDPFDFAQGRLDEDEDEDDEEEDYWVCGGSHRQEKPGQLSPHCI